MISAVMLMNGRGEVIIFRIYRDDVNRASADAFRLEVIARKETGSKPPVVSIDRSSFLYTRHSDLFFVAVTRSNVNPFLGFEFLNQMVRVFKAYFGDDFDENSIRNNFTLVYELLDETMDFGYPQNCAIDVLKMYINLGEVSVKQEEEQKQITSHITGTIDWRVEGIRHKKNEVGCVHTCIFLLF